MRIWLDDLRDPCKYGYNDAVWVKSSMEFYALLHNVKKEDITDIHFDNDLGELSESGYSCFVAIEYGLHQNIYENLENIFVHSSNPAAVSKFLLAKDAFKINYGVNIIYTPL